MKIKIVTLSILLFSFSCKSQDKSLFEISPPDFSDSTIALSEIADDIKYIPLDNQYPIGMRFCVKTNSDNIYISIKDIGVVQFDRHGKFVRNIGRVGIGPGEYRGMYFTVDETNERVYILDKDKILVYNKNGTFHRDFSYKEYIAGGDGGAGGIEMFKSLLFLPDYSINGNSKFDWIFLDTLGNLVSKKENSIQTSERGYIPRGDYYKFENKIFYFNCFNDTLFSISPDFKAYATYLFSPNISRALIESDNNPLSQLNRLFRIGDMFETKRNLFLYYGHYDKVAFMLIDKSSKRASLAYEKERTGRSVSTRASIKNDLDGGIPLTITPENNILYYYVENDSEYIASFINASELKAYITSDEFNSSSPKNPERKREIEALGKNIKETDNPILMTVRLKK
ncbi:MAG: 6-bladed beta-propeller [Ignavibacteriales bacterium]|nr:MAG: 6-bladed beta-propeller [Ignavibacteriales bacterium]